MELERRHFDIIDSTATWAKQNAHLFPKDKMTLVTAEGQTSGRGRFKRRWISPPGLNIYATFCHFIDSKRADFWNIPHLLALSTIKVLEGMGFNPCLKWPNDIKLSKKKVAGILAETVSIDEQLCIAVSIGLNVNMSAETIAEINQPATSLFVEKKHAFDIEDILREIRLLYLKELEVFNQEGFKPFLERFRKYASFSNPIQFDCGRSVFEGTFHSINEDGSLTLKLPSGELRTVVSGEIID